VVFFEAGGAKHGDAGAYEVEGAEAVEKVIYHAHEEAEVSGAGVGAAEEETVFKLGIELVLVADLTW
jgi:hypothetical protein